MKTLFLFLCLFTFASFAQNGTNPDGYIGGLSLHITPYFDWGSTDTFYYNSFGGQIDHSSTFNLHMEVVAPLSNKFSVSGFFKFYNSSSQYAPPPITYQRLEGSFFQIGGTFSIYFGGR